MLVCVIQVYLARDEDTGMLMAVKEILVADESDMDVAAATKEVELLRYLHHEHVIKYLGSSVDKDSKKLSILTVRRTRIHVVATSLRLADRIHCSIGMGSWREP